jgi:hypothetical protein
LAVVLAGSACSSEGGDGGTSLVGGGCGTDGAPPCAEVGAECVRGNACASGSCVGGQCVASGTSGAGGGGSIPGETGSGGSFILTDDFEPAAGSGEDVCVDLQVEFERITPTVVLLIDRSGSMEQAFDGGRDRWQTLVDTLTDPQSSLLERLQSSVRFGMALYSSDQGFGRGAQPRECPVLTSVEIGIENFSAMSAVLGDAANGPDGDTPTAESLAAVAAQLGAVTEPGPKSIILATDGDPDTCADPDSNNQQASKDLSVAAVQAAFAAGISTRVISVGDEVTQSHLKALAVAGAGGDAAAEAFTALNTEALESAFASIIGSVRTCDFTLEGTVAAADAARGRVLLDGAALAFGDANGWVMPDESTVRLQGSACDQIQSDATGISMSFPCDAIEIVPR